MSLTWVVVRITAQEDGRMISIIEVKNWMRLCIQTARSASLNSPYPFVTFQAPIYKVIFGKLWPIRFFVFQYKWDPTDLELGVLKDMIETTIPYFGMDKNVYKIYKNMWDISTIHCPRVAKLKNAIADLLIPENLVWDNKLEETVRSCILKVLDSPPPKRRKKIITCIGGREEICVES